MNMKKEEALKIIGMIADGLDPYGEKDPSKSLPETNPVTMRAFCTAIMPLLTIQDREELKSEYKAKSLFDLTDFVTGPLKDSLEKKEKWVIQDALDSTDFDEIEAAGKLGISVERLRTKLPKYSLDSLFLARKFFNEDRTRVTLDSFLEEIETQIIIEALNKARQRKTVAAELLGIDARSLRYRIERSRIDERTKHPTINYLDNYKADSLDSFLEEIEHAILRESLRRAGGRKDKAAKLLGTSFRSLRYKIEKFKIE